jgi:hypothetical protein
LTKNYSLLTKEYFFEFSKNIIFSLTNFFIRVSFLFGFVFIQTMLILSHVEKILHNNNAYELSYLNKTHGRVKPINTSLKIIILINISHVILSLCCI